MNRVAVYQNNLESAARGRLWIVFISIRSRSGHRMPRDCDVTHLIVHKTGTGKLDLGKYSLFYDLHLLKQNGLNS